MDRKKNWRRLVWASTSFAALATVPNLSVGDDVSAPEADTGQQAEAVPEGA
jgi:hypothetical protein